MTEPWTPGPWHEERGMLLSAEGYIVCDPYGFLPNPQDRSLIAAAPEMAELLEELTLVWCIQQKRGGLGAATCRSPIPGEGVPEDGWCRSCRARDLLSRIRGDAEVPA